jgi:arylsulfatase A-like enzyme
MLRDTRYKLIWYPLGNHLQLFDLEADPGELHDLAADPAHAATRDRLEALLVAQLYGKDSEWVRDGRLVGVPAPPYVAPQNRALSNQRGWKFM